MTTNIAHHRMLHRGFAVAALTVALLSSCSSTSSGAGDSTGGSSTTDVADETTTTTTTTVDLTTVDLTTASTTLPDSDDWVAPTVAPQPTTPPTMPPAGPATVPPILIPNPELCVAPGAASEPVHLVITDNGVRWNGAAAPACMRVPESFRFRFTNNAEGDASVAFGPGGGTIAAGDTQLTAPLGEIFFVGDTFQIAVLELATVINVIVLPIP